MATPPKLILDVGKDPEGGPAKQELFVMDDRTPFLLWRGGRGSSKTTSGWARMLRRRWNFPATKGLVLAPDYPKLDRGIIETVWRWTDKRAIKSFNRSPPQRLELINDSVVDFFTASDPNVTRSLECHDVWFDEYAYCPYGSWKVALACRRLKPPRGMRNSMWATGTPRGYDWSFKVFGEDGRPGYRVFRSSTYEARDHLAEGTIEALEEEYRGTDFELQELYGEYSAGEGLIYHQLDDYNLWLPAGTPTFDIAVGGIDLGDVAPTVLAPLGIMRGELWCPEEFYGRRVALSDLLQTMAAFEAKYSVRTWFCETTADFFIGSARAAGFDVRPCPIKDVETGIRIVQHYLRDNMLHLHRERCPQGLREMRSYQRKTQDLGETYSDTIVKADDHFPDALRYAVVGYEMTRVVMPGEERQRPVRTGDFYSWDEARVHVWENPFKEPAHTFGSW